MSFYKNFTQDFPGRCKTLLDRYFEIELKRPFSERHEVTLLISVALSGFVIPFERVRDDMNKKKEHPSKDREQLSNKEYFSFNSKFNKHLSLSSGITNRWVCGQVKEYGEEYFSQKEAVSVLGMDIRAIFPKLRNSLAHGNVKTSSEREEITDILLYSEIKDKNGDQLPGYWMNKIPVDDFYRFLLNWLTYLESYKKEPLDVVRGLDEAIRNFKPQEYEKRA